MKLRTIVGLAPALFVFAACGGDNGPSISQVRQDFASPSGSVNDKTALIDATGNRNSTDAALKLSGGGGVPGRGLTTANARGLEQIAPLRMHGRGIEYLRNYVSNRGTTTQGLEGDGTDACADSAEVTGAFMAAVNDLENHASASGASGSGSYSIDVGACSNGQLTGKLSGTLSINVQLDGRGGGTFTMSMSQTLTDVCETSGNQTCVNGTFVAEASGSGNDIGGMIDVITAWDVKVAWNENGEALTAETKGGIHISGLGTEMGGQGQIEFLLYAKDSTGAEVSFVLTIVADAGGAVTWTYRGSDGEASCRVEADGSGSCTGPEGMISWTSTEYDAELKR